MYLKEQTRVAAFGLVDLFLCCIAASCSPHHLSEEAFRGKSRDNQKFCHRNTHARTYLHTQRRHNLHIHTYTHEPYRNYIHTHTHTCVQISRLCAATGPIQRGLASEECRQQKTCYLIAIAAL
jgi:hypothetical protein